MLDKPVIWGRLVTLRPLTVKDAPAILASMEDAETMRLTGTQQQFALPQIEAFCRAVVDADDRADYAITLGDDPAYIGEAVLNNIDWTNRTASFRIA